MAQTARNITVITKSKILEDMDTALLRKRHSGPILELTYFHEQVLSVDFGMVIRKK